MNKINLILAIVFIMVFIAGGAAGLSLSRTKSTAPRGRDYLASELNLTDQQKQQMKEIWQQAMRQSREAHRQRHDQLKQVRDQAVLDMLTPDQQITFEQIQAEYEKGVTQLAQLREQVIDEAVNQTRAILTPEQVQRYDELRLKDRSRYGKYGYRNRDNTSEQDGQTDK